MTLPPFLQHRDPEREHDREWARDAYAQRGAQDRRLLIDNGYGPAPLDLDTALQMFERLADAELAPPGLDS